MASSTPAFSLWAYITRVPQPWLQRCLRCAGCIQPATRSGGVRPLSFCHSESARRHFTYAGSVRNGQRQARADRAAIDRRLQMENTSSSGNPLLELSDNLAAIVERVGQSVVAVHGRRRIPSSGVIWRHDVVVTAAHTLRREEGIEVTLADGRVAAAVLAGRDTGTDVAVLKLDGVDLDPVES